MDIRTSPRTWGYSRRPKNWNATTWNKMMLKEFGETEENDSETHARYDLFELVARQAPVKSRTLTDEEVRNLGLQNTDNKPQNNLLTVPMVKPQIAPVKPSSGTPISGKPISGKPQNKPDSGIPLDSSGSYL